MGKISSFVKYVSWGVVTSLAMEYVPELFRQMREDAQAHPSAAEAELNERISRLEKLLLEQENIIGEQTSRNGLLEESCMVFESQLAVWKIVTAIAISITLVIFVLLILRW